MLKDFETFLNFQKPHKEKRLVEVRKIRPDRAHIKRPQTADYEWIIEEQEHLTKQGLVTMVQFAAWKGVHRTTITTGYSEGEFKEVHDQIKAICEAFSERKLYEAERNAANIIFAMKNAYGWVDKTEHELSGTLDTPLSDEAKAYLAKATQTDDKGFSDE